MTQPRLIARLREAYAGFSAHDGPLVAAGVAYYLALSFFPLLLVLAAGLAYALQWTAKGQDAKQWIVTAIEEQASPELAESVHQALETAGTQAPAIGSFGFAALVVTAIAIFTQVDYAFDRIWGLTGRPSESWTRWLRRLIFARFKALFVLICLGAFIILIMVAAVVWSSLVDRISSLVAINRWFTWGAGLVLSMFLNFLAFSFAYRFLPELKVRWREALAGAVVASALWEVGRQGLALYLVRQDYPTAYGIIGSFLAIMLWAYYAMIVVLFGAEFVRTVQLERLEEAKELREARREQRERADSENI